MSPDELHDFRESESYDAARAESDLAFIAKKRREIEWWQHNISAADEKIARAEQRIKAFAIQYRQTVGGSQISMANGFVTVKKAGEKTEIHDPVEWKAWRDSKEWSKDYYDAPSLNDSKVKGALQLNKDGTYSFDTGQIIAGQHVVQTVPGIRRVKPGPMDFNVKINAGRDLDHKQLADDVWNKIPPSMRPATEESTDADD